MNLFRTLVPILPPLTLTLVLVLLLGGCSTQVQVAADRQGSLASREVSSVSLSGMTSPETAAESAVRKGLVSSLGRDRKVRTTGFDLDANMQIGADYQVSDDVQPYTIKNPDTGRTTTMYSITRTYTLNGTYQMSDLDGMIASGTFNQSATKRGQAASPQAAATAVPAGSAQLNMLAFKAGDQIRREAFPHIDRAMVSLKGGGGEINDANKLVAARQVEQAKGIYTRVLDTPNAKPKDREAAAFNLGVIAEIEGDRDAARGYYQAAQDIDMTDKRALQAMQRMDVQDGLVAEELQDPDASEGGFLNSLGNMFGN